MWETIERQNMQAYKWIDPRFLNASNAQSDYTFSLPTSVNKCMCERARYKHLSSAYAYPYNSALFTHKLTAIVVPALAEQKIQLWAACTDH